MKVYIKDPGMVKFMKHPVGNIGFIDASTPAEWPDDTFTHRRLQDGDITLDAPLPKKIDQPQPEADASQLKFTKDGKETK